MSSEPETKYNPAELPARLPVGRTEFEEWAKSIIDLSGAPDNDSTRFALASMILHASPDKSNVPKQEFVSKLQKFMSNQVAAAIMQELKAKQEAALKAAAEEAKKAEQPTLSVVPDSQVQTSGEAK